MEFAFIVEHATLVVQGVAPIALILSPVFAAIMRLPRG